MRQAVTVGTTITEISPAAEQVKGVTRNLSNVIVKNLSAEVVYLQWTNEDNDLTTANGFPLDQNEAVAIAREWGGAPILGIVAANTANVRVAGD
tara:strand:+ start:378 stop:659 length:282 start_codon:yes stop_codon:yes gene_type:complete